MNSPDLLELSRELTRLRQPHAWITVIAVKGPSSSYVGAQAIVQSDGAITGWIGGGCVQSVAQSAALRSISAAVPQRLRLSNTKDPGEAVDVRPMACASNGEVEIFIQPAAIAPRLRIYGNTPVARVAAALAREVDFDPVDEQETYALIATQGDGDEAALEAALRSPARAVLIIASRRKTERLRKAMELRGIAPERLDAIQAPAGPDIGATTPNEIALAAVAGLISLRRNATNSSSTDTQSPTQAQTGYINPVCGAVVDPARALSTLTLRGQTHYFCCQGCRTEFERAPDKYLEIGAHMREPARTTQES